MLDKMRENSKGLLSWAIVILIGLTFAMWGVSDYFSGSFGRKYAAKVNGEKLSWHEVELNYERARRQKGASGLSERDLKEQIRLSLIQRAALLSNVRFLGFQVGETQLAETLVQLPVFHEDGKFSKEHYLEVLNSNGYTDAAFRKELEQDILLDQLAQGLTQTNFSLPSEVAKVVELVDEKRNFGYLILNQDKFRTGIEISNDELKNYYEKHKNDFVIPESVSVEYLELSLDQMAKQQKISEAELKDFYKEHLASYSAPERVRARHILISVPNHTQDNEKTNSAKNEEEAKTEAKIQDLLKKINSGEDFSLLAKEHSEDKGSAKNGGDLGWFTKGQMVPAFDKAVFALNKPKEVVGPIRTQFGFHLIQLIEHKPAETRGFNEVHDLVLEQMQREKALPVFIEQSEALSKLAFEKNSSLNPIAEELGLKIKETGFFSRKSDPYSNLDDNSSESSKITENPFVIATAFSDGVFKQKNNSEPIQVGEYDLVVLRLKENKPAVQKTFEETSKKIHEVLMVERSKDKVKELAESIKLRIREGESPAKMASNLNLAWNEKTDVTRQNSDKSLNKDIVTAVFKFPRALQSDKEPLKAFVLPNGDYAIVVLHKVIPGNIADVDSSMQNAYRRSVRDEIAQLEFNLYANQVLNEARIEVTEQDGSKS